jgi:NADH dehydrogenase
VFAFHAITDRLAGRTRTPRPLRFQDGLLMSLGRRDGLMQHLNPDNSPRDKVRTGRPAALYKEFVLRSVTYGMRHPATTDLGVRRL